MFCYSQIESYLVSLDQQSTKALNELVIRMAAGEKDAFSCLYQMFYNKLLRYGTIIVAEQDLVKDAIQDLFAWILDNPGKLQSIQNIEVYLFQSLKKNLHHHIKARNRKGIILRQFSHSQHIPANPDNIEQRIIRKENQDFDRYWVRKQISELPPRQKEIIYLRYYEGLSYDEIAEIIATSNQVVRNYASRALQRIRKMTGKLNKTVFRSFT